MAKQGRSYIEWLSDESTLSRVQDSAESHHCRRPANADDEAVKQITGNVFLPLTDTSISDRHWCRFDGVSGFHSSPWFKVGGYFRFDNVSYWKSKTEQNTALRRFAIFNAFQALNASLASDTHNKAVALFKVALTL